MDQEEQQVGSYRLHKHLEHGIVADAYLATDISTNKQVIVKVFPVTTTISEEHLAPFIAYIRACTHLEDPDILHVLDFGQEGEADTSTLFLVTDVPGETLRQRHPQGLPLPLDTIALYVSQIASALQFAHDQQVLHLDLRPEQLFVGLDGRILLDYTHKLLYSITPTFIPVDAVYTLQEPPTPASDQYALAIIIYEWLNGIVPLSDTASGAVVTQRSLPVSGEHVSTIWSRVEHVLNQALAPDPAQRYENVQAFADAFILALNVGPEATRRREERRHQVSFSGSTSFMRGVIDIEQPAPNWHNPFSSGVGYTMHSIRTLAFSPDSKRLAFNSGEPEVHVATMAGQDTLFTYHGHTDPVAAIAWSPDGQTIASASSSGTTGTIQIWEVTTGKLLTSYPVNSSLRELRWSPDGRFIATAGWDRTVSIWQAFTGNTLLTYSGHSSSVSSVAWSPDSSRITSASSGEIHVWEIATGTLICTYYGHFGLVNAAAWSPDGTMIASGGDDMTIQIWNAATRAPIFIHRPSSSTIVAIGWSPDGEYVITGMHDDVVQVQVYDIKDGTNVFRFYSHIMHHTYAGSIGWSPDLNILAIGREDRRVEIANRTSGELLLCRAPAALIEKIGQGNSSQGEMTRTTSSRSISTGETTNTTTTTTTITPSSPPVVRTTTRQHRTVRVWGGKDNRDMVTYFGHKSVVKPLAWSLDSGCIASGGYDGSMHVWDAMTSTTIFIYRGHLDPVAAVAWSPDGTRLASGSLDHTVKIWDRLTGQEILTYRGHKNFVQTLAWSPDRTRVASGSKDNTVQVWDARSGRTILTYNEHTAAINGVSWSADGQHIATGSDDQTVHIWEAATGNTVFVYRNHATAVLDVMWSPDGKRIASSCASRRRHYEHGIHASENETRLHIWTVDQTAPIYGQDEQQGIHYDISSISWSPDGQMIATQDFPHARIYDASTGEAIAVIMNQQPGQHREKLLNVAWSPDGTRIAGSHSNGRVQVWLARAQSS